MTDQEKFDALDGLHGQVKAIILHSTAPAGTQMAPFNWGNFWKNAVTLGNIVVPLIPGLPGQIIGVIWPGLVKLVGSVPTDPALPPPATS